MPMSSPPPISSGHGAARGSPKAPPPHLANLVTRKFTHSPLRIRHPKRNAEFAQFAQFGGFFLKRLPCLITLTRHLFYEEEHRLSGLAWLFGPFSYEVAPGSVYVNTYLAQPTTWGGGRFAIWGA